jgi:hypothetical protein
MSNLKKTAGKTAPIANPEFAVNITTGEKLVFMDDKQEVPLQPIVVLSKIENKKDTKRSDGSVRTRDYSGWRVKLMTTGIVTCIESGNLIDDLGDLAGKCLTEFGDTVALNDGIQLGYADGKWHA